MASSVSSSSSDAELVAAIPRDAQAIGWLYERHADLLLRWFGSRLDGDLVVAADLVTDTFLVVLADHRRFSPACGPALGWIFGIAHHKLADHWRARAVERRATARLQAQMPRFHEDDLEHLRSRLDAESEADVLRAAVRGLPPADRQAVEAVYLRGQTPSEAASELQISPNAVRQRLHRSRTRLARSIEKDTP